MSDAWLNFARTGNPGVGSLPAWEAYTPQSGATMYFDNECRVLNNHDKELLEVVRSFPTRGFCRRRLRPGGEAFRPAGA